ncbi:hypothetical protein AABB02_35220 [Streptomyces rimosus]|uniref:hypothetical protein n=1 Tax=Streptomyces rimosus TaxID=1927 RepID=UPI0031D3F431
MRGLRDNKGGGSTKGNWLFENSLIGDVMGVKNLPEQAVKPDNCLNGRHLSWTEWQAGSAL